MRGQIDRYLRKLVVHGLVSGPGDAQLYGLDDEITSSGDTVPAEARALFDALNINSLIIAKPEPVRWTIISELLREGVTSFARPIRKASHSSMMSRWSDPSTRRRSHRP